MIERLNCVKKLVFTRTRLEFRLLWNKIFQKQDEELGWLLNPYKQSKNATMMSTFSRNFDGPSYQYDYDKFKDSLGGPEKVTIYNRGIAKKSDHTDKDDRSFADKALQIARYMGMGVYMTSSAYPSPLRPIDDEHLYDENYYGPTNYYMSRIW